MATVISLIATLVGDSYSVQIYESATPYRGRSIPDPRYPSIGITNSKICMM
jgi:hypothetical protein